MKKKLVFAIMVIYLMILAGCVNDSIAPVEKWSDDTLEGGSNESTLSNDSFKLIEEDLDIYINGNIINYKMLKEEITSILGQPLEVLYYEDLDNYETYKYDGLEITFMGSYADFLVIDNNSYPTHRDICVGDNIDEMFKSYGEVNPVDVHDGEKYYMYSLMNDGIEIQLFFVEYQNKIKEYYFSNSL